MLQRSKWSGVVLSAAVGAAGMFSMAAAVRGQAAPAAEAATAPAASAVSAAAAAMADKKLSAMADDFLHYSLVNNTELAQANGEALLASSAPASDILLAFEDAASGRDYRDVLIQDQRREGLKDVATKLQARLDEGFRSVARDPKRIREEVNRLANGPRAYQSARDHLAAAGEYAAPIFLEYLQDSNKRDLQPFIIRIMGEIGRPLLNPLVEALRSNDPGLRTVLVNVLGQIGYPQALPTLRAMQMDAGTSPEIKNALDSAIALIDRSGQAARMAPADLYLRGAQNYYDNKASYQPLLADEKTNPVWIFDTGLNNVVPVQVPTAIWNNVMALRMSQATLKLDANNGEAISLWLAANLRREIQLPAGAVDPTKDADSPSASFYALAAGPMYVNPVLDKALNAGDSALALRAIEALEATGGANGLVASGASPLVRALSYPDRAVRFRAAFTLARANPTSQYPSFFRVVPILAEAVSSTGSPTALVVESNDDVRNALTEVLRNSAAHYSVYAGPTLSAALDAARRAPAIDVVVVAGGGGGGDVGRVGTIIHTDYRLGGASVLVTAPAADVPQMKLQMSGSTGYGVIAETADDAAITAALTQARAGAGNVTLDTEKATQFAMTALDLLGMLAADHRSIYNVAEAVPTLVDALHDKRPEIVTASARVLGQLNSADGEQALAAAALGADREAPMRIIFFQQLAESAKRTQNSLEATAINGIIKAVSSDPDSKIRPAAATALGALNVPSNQASTLILQQAK